MIDNLALGLSHGLMMLTVFLLLKRPDLDRESPPGEPSAQPVVDPKIARGFARRREIR